MILDNSKQDDAYLMRPLRAGSFILPTSGEYSVEVLSCWLVYASTKDTYAQWLVVCHLPHNDFHPYAVWDAYDRPEGWSLGGGDYFRRLDDAMERYRKRGGI